MLSEEERKRIEAVIDKELGGTEGVMIRKSYHCKDESEVDYFLRRYLAS